MVKRKHDKAAEDLVPEYEKARKRNISRNEDILHSLKIKSESSDLLTSSAKKSATKKPKTKKTDVETLKDELPRRSTRERKEVATYNDEELFREAEKPKAGAYIPPNTPAGMKVAHNFTSLLIPSNFLPNPFTVDRLSLQASAGTPS